MDQYLATNLSRNLNISVDRIVREEKEILMLRELFSSPAGNLLVFRGGSALRLALGSPRFSDELDFSCIAPVGNGVFSDVVEGMAKKFPGSKVSDLVSKRFTFLAQLKFKEDWVKTAYTIKIEVSKRRTYKKGAGYELKLISSPASNVQVLGNVSTLDRILEEKIVALRDRGEPRDLFDIWFVCERRNQPLPKLDASIDRRVLRRELRKYLPSDFWPVVAQLEKEMT